MRYRFDRFELDCERFCLRAEGDEIHVEPLVFDLLRFLVEHAGQVVTRDLIIENVWDGRIVSEATVSSCIKSARKALDDNGRSQTYIRTIHGRDSDASSVGVGRPIGGRAELVGRRITLAPTVILPRRYAV